MVKLYDVTIEHNWGDPYAVMEESASGEWVSEDDYGNLLIDLKDLRAKYDKLVEKLGDLWREG